MSSQRELFHESNIGLVHQIKNPILKLQILFFFFFKNEFTDFQRAGNCLFDKHINCCIDVFCLQKQSVNFVKKKKDL
jgi:hypothetical protein